MANFIRTKHYAYACLGKHQKSKRKYRRPTGRHNKMRQKWKGRTPMVEIGYKNNDSTRGLIEGKKPVLISNLNDLLKMEKNTVAILAKIGNKAKFEIAKEANSKKIEILNLNVKRFIRKMERKNSKSKTPEIKEAKK